jgi:hypothetical protein
MQIMCIVDEQDDQSLPLFDWVSQCAFPSFGLSEDLKILAHWTMQAKPFDHFEKQGRRGWRALKRSSASAGSVELFLITSF